MLSVTSVTSVLLLAQEVRSIRGSILHRRTPTRVAPNAIAYRTTSGARGDLPAQEPTVVLFTLSQCSACDALLPTLRAIPNELRSRILLVARATPDEAEVMRASAELSFDRVVPDRTGVMASQFGVGAFPAAMITSEGTAASPVPVASREDVVRLLEKLSVSGAGARLVPHHRDATAAD